MPFLNNFGVFVVKFNVRISVNISRCMVVDVYLRKHTRTIFCLIGNPTCRQKTLDVGKSISLAQAVGQ